MNLSGWEAELPQLIEQLPRERRESDPAFEPSIGYPNEVRAEVQRSGIAIYSCRPRWSGVAALEVDWQEEALIPWEQIEAAGDPEELVAQALREARRKRIRSYRRCRSCRAIKAPEWMHDRDVCMSCATGEGGVY